MTASPSTPRRQPTASTSISSTPATPSFEPSSQDLDDPTSTPTAYTRSNNPSTKTSAPAEDSDNEDEAPDYLRLLSTLNSKSKTSSTSGIVIPKRGEKDFEPTGFGGQSKLLERSREAMFQAVSGERRVGSRSLVRATWNASSRRARLLDVQGKIFETVGVIRREQVKDHVTGKTITKAWNELLPEEALFLAERGSLQIYQTEKEQAEGGEEEALVPMSLQQAFAMLMLPPDGSADEAMQQDEPLTREAYLIYAHLKRLGYVVQRASIVDAIRAAPISASTLAKKNNSSNSSGSAQAKQPLTASQALKSKKGAQADGIIADPQRPIKLTTIWDILLYIPRRMIQLGGDGVSAIARWIEWVWRNTMVELGRRISETAKKILGSKGATSGKTIGSLGLGLGLHKQHQDGRRFLGDSIEWDSYDAVFQSLQIVPSGHDFWLPSSDEPPTSAATTSPPAATDTIRLAPLKPTQRPSSDHLQPFYYAWRPATLYRKSHPPPPEFRIVILNARTTPVPSIWRFESIFAHIPMPGSDAELFGSISNVDGSDQGMSSEEFRERVEYEKQLKASNEAKNRAAYGKFSDGKQKFLRERAEARQLAAAQRRASNETGLRGTMMGKVLIRVISLDFTIVKSVARLFRHSPGCYAPLLPHRARFNHHNRNRTAAGANRDGGNGRGSTGNPFPPLKAGRRSVVVAVVDGSITTLLRFGEAEFAWWSLYGVQQEEGGQEAK
ncbi:tRNA-splicing endonuclease subunit sen54 [Pseudozyma hubeiensis SY62]|uniref:tRNA-splicing endonuclease subunit sen54 n=1 Tax=Pseudozyma hubeiensis (strain SY62) TaxID=1305764 RepID=R9PJM6_PSEHS|nr:tRNA-splicing endonuclease subunit sen54 [Pseudozyma hubeiensis SY62]GAC98300.1 tRNA-splicing endonuclease subunit sen54 [Pseudozyma hubeiensis SY62]